MKKPAAVVNRHGLCDSNIVQRLFVFKQRMIELGNVGALLLGVCDRLAGMTVEQTRKHVLNIIAPNYAVFTELRHIFFHKLKQGI